MSQINIIIVDDEPFAREKLRTLLANESDTSIIGEYDNGWDAIDGIIEKRPDLVFLDISMPGMSGMDVVHKIGVENLSQFVFVTAHNEFAPEAFELNALDYLLKPFDYNRLQKTLRRFHQQQQASRYLDLDFQVNQLLTSIQPKKTNYLERLMIKSGNDIFFVKTADIDWIEAAGNYVYLHIGTKTRLLRDTMNNLATKLDPKKFVRIHRSQIVNIERIKKMQPSSHGEYLVIMGDNTELLLTRTYRENLLGLFEMAN